MFRITRQTMQTIVLRGGVALCVLAVLAGCTRYHDVEAFELEPHRLDNLKPYRVGPPDMLAIQSRVVTEISGQTVTVSPDGTVMLPLLGTVHVMGKTPAQIAADLEGRARTYYHDADVTVNVAAYRSKFIYVFGEVGRSGQFPYTGANSVLELLAAAQPTRAADPDRIQIIRRRGDGKNADRMTIKLSKWVEKGETDRNALLEDGDIVFVPPNGFAEIGYAFQNLLRPVTPASNIVNGTSGVDSGSASLRR